MRPLRSSVVKTKLTYSFISFNTLSYKLHSANVGVGYVPDSVLFIGAFVSAILSFRTRKFFFKPLSLPRLNFKQLFKINKLFFSTNLTRYMASHICLTNRTVALGQKPPNNNICLRHKPHTLYFKLTTQTQVVNLCVGPNYFLE